jgi:hypothetical protein
MRYLLLIACATLLLGAAPAMSQVAPSGLGASPGMGITSPLGGAGPVGQVGIPLGSTELDPGGLSPGPLGPTSSLCGTNGTSMAAPGMAGMTGSGSTFDGGGNVGVSGPCGAVPLGGTVSGTQSASAVAGATAGSALGIGTIPLGATEIVSSGISPLVPVPAPPPTLNPSPSTTFDSLSPTLSPSSPCVGSTTTSGVFGTSGISSPLGC